MNNGLKNRIENDPKMQKMKEVMAQKNWSLLKKTKFLAEFTQVSLALPNMLCPKCKQLCMQHAFRKDYKVQYCAKCTEMYKRAFDPFLKELNS